MVLKYKFQSKKNAKNKSKKESEEIGELNPGVTWVEPGHFYSPIPDLNYVRENSSRLFNPGVSELPGINLGIEDQFELINILKKYYYLLPFTPHQNKHFRFFYENNAYSYSDAIFYFLIIMNYRPKQIVEVGSGYSSALACDVNEKFFNNEIKLNFIDPNPSLLKELLGVSHDYNVFENEVQSIDPKIFWDLNQGDILFIDSTHVSKIGSDVNYLYFEILPKLKPGVLIHIHDIHSNFEYFKEWIFEGRVWNENYLLRAYLINNSKIRILLMNTRLQKVYRTWFINEMPLCLENEGGSIWLQVLE